MSTEEQGDILPSNDKDVQWAFDELIEQYAAGNIDCLIIGMILKDGNYECVTSKASSYLEKIGLAHKLLDVIDSQAVEVDE